MPTTKLSQLASLLHETAKMHRLNAAVMREYADMERIAAGLDRLADQLEVTAEQIDAGQYDEPRRLTAPGTVRHPSKSEQDTNTIEVVHLYDVGYPKPLCNADAAAHPCWHPAAMWPRYSHCKPNCPGCGKPICPLCNDIFCSRGGSA